MCRHQLRPRREGLPPGIAAESLLPSPCLAQRRAEAEPAPVSRPGWMCECPSVHWDLRVGGVEPGLPLHPSSPPSSPYPPWAAWCSALPSLCCSHFPTPGAQHFDVKPSAPFLLSLQPPPHHHLLKNGRKKKTVKRGMLTDKPPQLSEASMSVLWMFLFTS
ncbi:hypothetical protein mRhiFer1_009869 [Rhinolophus ferrumequinum]|uniref:Uncharacterized protein n=1 Tax=Rhinolophus ferrumequinum TaxID=59479 RepID=A0A7J7YSD8_RHIFE|nr:hypothetical protein mRhiFer1_009869 [Rhinolophus ferrumequinum]